MVERLAAVIIGGVSIYLGYRLFQTVKATGEGSGSVKLPGDVTVMVSRVAPGVFFALFGAVVVVMSYAFPFYYEEPGGGGGLFISGVGSEPELASAVSNPSSPPDASAARTAEDLLADRNRVRRHVKFLNEMHDRVAGGLSDVQRKRAKQETVAAKLHLMRGVWGDDWAEFEKFQPWAEDYGSPDDSQVFRDTAEFFTFGAEEDP